MTEQGVDIDSLANFSPEMIAHEIFTKDAKAPCTHQILAYQEGSDMTYIYEILITILLEGLEIMTGGLKEIDLSGFNSSYITVLNPWFRSIGFNINVDTFESSDKESYNGYYCRAVINDKLNETFFIMKNLEHKPYHFLLNGPNLQINKSKEYLKDIYGIFSTDDTVYKISFDFYIPTENVNSTKLL